MEITCWNCKKTYTLDAKAIAGALVAMDASKLNFFDVLCPHCGKENRAKREQFVAPPAKPVAASEPKLRAVDAKKAKEKEKKALEKKKGYKGK